MTSEDKSLTCPSCGEEASGNFCQHCGAGLGGRFCNQCGEQIPTGSRFCNHCGAPLAGGSPAPVAPTPPATAATAAGPASQPATAGTATARREAAREVISGQNLPWWIAGVSMFVLILFVGMNMVRPGPGPAPSPSGPVPQATGGAAAGGGVAPDISNMTPIEAADRLFNRVMQSIAERDSVQARSFMPMAIAAYQRARPLSLDGLFHLSMLNRTAMNLEAALDNALEILEQDPDHLLGLAAAAEAAIELGELDEAERHYQQLFDVYDAEMESPRQEYLDHNAITSVLKEDAERFLASR